MNFDAMGAFLDRLTAWRIPGNSVSVCIGGKEVYTYQSGFADVEKQIPMTTDHYINIYSCSKVATVTAALQLYEKGCFLLDDPLYEFIPEYKDMYITDGQGTRKARNPITLRHLFTMTSGLNYDMYSKSFDRARELTEGRMETLEVARCIAGEPLSFEPGAHWQYSLSHDVLAAVVEVISGKKFRNYMKDNIFDPLGMTKTMYHSESVRDKMAQQYRYVNSQETDVVAQQSGAGSQGDGEAVIDNTMEFVFGPEYDSGGAGITTTVSDYSKFCAALANGGIGATGEKILSAGTIELLHTNQLNEQQLKDLNWPNLKGYGYGLGVRTLIDRVASGSNGSFGEFGWGGAAGASVLVDTRENVSVFYAHHMLNSQEVYYQPRLRNVLYGCLL